jgi:hypothetical protein
MECMEAEDLKKTGLQNLYMYFLMHNIYQTLESFVISNFRLGF